MGSITTFPIPTVTVSGLTASLLSPVDGDLFAGVQVGNPAQSPSGSLVKYSWQQMMTSPNVRTKLTVTGGTVTTAGSLIYASATWNNGAATFDGLFLDLTNTASGAASRPILVRVGGSTVFDVATSGAIHTVDDLTVDGDSILTGASGVASGVTVRATTQLQAITTNQTAGGLSLLDDTTSAFAGFGPKNLGVKAYVGADKAGVQVTGSSDGDAFLRSISGSVWLGSGSNGALKVDTSNDVNAMLGNLNIVTAGKGAAIKSGANCRLNSATLSGGAVVISNSTFTANTRLFFGVTALSGVQGILSYTIGAGTATVTSSNGADASTFWYLAVEAT